MSHNSESEQEMSQNSQTSEIPYELPEDLIWLETLGSGSYGKVLKCWDKVTRSIVAVKIPITEQDTTELDIMKMLQSSECDRYNIIKFIRSFDYGPGKGLVFEKLDVDLHDYIFSLNKEPLKLSDIRAIVKQMAVALIALKSLGIIHADIKEDNIIFQHCLRPITIKLIDFGVAITRDQIEQGAELQALCFRAPELLLGLPFSEAIDMWSLGCVMYTMLTCSHISEAETPYQAMLTLVDLLGMPPDDLLERAPEAHQFFTKTENGWEIKNEELSEPFERIYKDFSLDELQDVRLENENMFEAEERKQCVELLKLLLVMDWRKRITPAEVLSHPFITGIKTQNPPKGLRD